MVAPCAYACAFAQRLVMAGHSVSNRLSLEAQRGGMLTDGMGSGGHNVSVTGQDFATVQAGAGQVAQLILLALWMHSGNNLRVAVDDEDEVVLSGTMLPPEGRTFRSKSGGTIKLLLVTDDLASLSFVSLSVHAKCVEAFGCGAHGSCNSGNCTCSDGYSGMGAFVSLFLLWRTPLSCGLAHAVSATPRSACLVRIGCQCGAGYEPSASGGGVACVVDRCYNKTCSGHGTCDKDCGECHCVAGYIGAECAQTNSFLGSRLIAPEWSGSLDTWMPTSLKGKQWTQCFSSFIDDATTPSTFHKQCDEYDTTLTVARNSHNYTFGGYVRFPVVFVNSLLYDCARIRCSPSLGVDTPPHSLCAHARRMEAGAGTGVARGATTGATTTIVPTLVHANVAFHVLRTKARTSSIP
eukprot:COSAG02_NODE_2441_length_8858_cov_31.570271_12_plen_408_part_00